ncbi:MAG: GNAT family N-acetyltransferase, partial [Hydrogenophaga sp.]|nr:GNAT family N-acetyltransferase [Hydrogenophaga sp.]
MAAAVSVRRADYANPHDAASLVMLLDAYASDPAGGGDGLSDFAKSHLVRELAARPQAYSVLAFDGDAPVGLVNCIEGFSTFACKPLVNVHDVAVLSSHRGRGIAEQMLALAEIIA